MDQKTRNALLDALSVMRYVRDEVKNINTDEEVDRIDQNLENQIENLNGLLEENAYEWAQESGAKPSNGTVSAVNVHDSLSLDADVTPKTSDFWDGRSKLSNEDKIRMLESLLDGD